MRRFFGPAPRAEFGSIPLPSLCLTSGRFGHTVTLAGSGGIGKSRLAVHAGDDLGRHFRDGVWLVELGELDSPERLPQALAHVLKVYERPGGVIDDALLGHLRERRLLFLLDNCEGSFNDLRHTFASHLIVDLRLDVCQVSRILGHARTAITLDVYTHLFEQARHAADVRPAMAGSRFGQILAEATAPDPRPASWVRSMRLGVRIRLD